MKNLVKVFALILCVAGMSSCNDTSNPAAKVDTDAPAEIVAPANPDSSATEAKTEKDSTAQPAN